MTPSARWLIGLGWAFPALVAAALLVARWTSNGGTDWLAGAATTLLLVAPVLPLSLILFTVAAIAGRHTLWHDRSGYRRADYVFLGAAILGTVLSVASLGAAVILYVG